MRILIVLLLTLPLAACSSDGNAPGDGACGPIAAPEPRAPAAIVRCGPSAQQSIALTFEAAGGAQEAAAIIATLAGARVPATFVVTGLWAEAHPQLLNTIAAGGHQLVNGGYSGASFTGAWSGTAPMTAEQRGSTLSRTETTVFRMSSRSTRPWFRPPHGDYDEDLLRQASAAGYSRALLWSIDATGLTRDAMVRAVRDRAAPGGIVRLGIDADTAAALPEVIEGLRAEGYSFERAVEIIE